MDAFYQQKAMDMVQPFEKPAIIDEPIRQAFVETEPNSPDPIPPKKSIVQQSAGDEKKPRHPKLASVNFYLEHIDEGY